MTSRLQVDASRAAFEQLVKRFPETAADVEKALRAIDKGGAVVPGGIAHPAQRELFTRVLVDWGLKERDGAYFKKKPEADASMVDELIGAVPAPRASLVSAAPHVVAAPAQPAQPPRPVLGPAAPPPASAAPATSSDSSNDDDDDAGPQPAGAANARRPAPAAATAASSGASSKREAWMSEAPTEADGQRHLRVQAMTSQKARGFASTKASGDAPAVAMSAADKRVKQELAAYDRGAPLAAAAAAAAAAGAANEPKAFKWDYNAMMDDNTIDKERSKALLTGKESIESRFTAPQVTRRFL